MKNNVLVLGNIKEENSKSMQGYLSNLKANLDNADYLSPSAKLTPKLYKLFFYPFKIKKNYDLYHIIDHSYANLCFFLPKKKTVVTCHDLIPLKFPDKVSFFGRILFHHYMGGLKKAEKIIADSQNTKEDLMKLLGIEEGKIKVIYLGLDTTHFKNMQKSTARKKMKLPIKDYFILSVGAGVFYKNNILTLKALNSLTKKNKDIKLIKVGFFTPEEEAFILENKLEDKILRKKTISFGELKKLYCASDVLSFPSLYEGFGWPPLESMACGVPVITSNASSLPEVVNDAAIKINPNSVEELCRAILKVKEDPAFRASLIKKGFQNIKRFTWEKHVNELEKVYSEILKNNVRNKRI